MKLARRGREYYRLEIVTIPQLTAWDASFDGGLTWVSGLFDAPTNTQSWLVYGPLFTPDATPATMITKDTKPLVRASSNPEVVIRDAPNIVLVNGG